MEIYPFLKRQRDEDWVRLHIKPRKVKMFFGEPLTTKDQYYLTASKRRYDQTPDGKRVSNIAASLKGVMEIGRIESFRYVESPKIKDK